MRVTQREVERITRALTVSRDDIISDWEQVARARTASRRLPREALRDHLPQLVERIVDELPRVAVDEEARGVREPATELALGRLVHAVDLPDALEELDHLSEWIFRHLWCQTNGTVTLDEVALTHRAIERTTEQVAEAYFSARLNMINALERMAAVAIEGLPLEATLQQLLTVITETTPGVDSATIFLRDEDVLRIRATTGGRAAEKGRFALRIGEGFVGRIAAERRPRFTPDAHADPEVKSRWVRDAGVKALYGVPMLSRGQLVGVVTIGSIAEHGFSAFTRQLVQVLAERAADVVGFALLQGERERLVDELERALARAKVEAQRLDAVLEAIADGLALCSQDGRIIRANAAADEILALREVRDPSITDSVARTKPVDAQGRPIAAGETPMARALRGEVVRSVEMRIAMDDDPEGRWLSVSAAPIIDVSGPCGEVRGAVATWSDITRLHRLQEDRETLMRAIAHDIRTPIGTIAIQGELLEKNAGDPDKVRRSAAIIRSSTGRIRTMSDELVDMARFETGQIRPSPERLPLDRFVEEMLARLAGVMPIERVVVSIEPGATVWADPAMLERVLANLLTNALKYADPDRPVRLSAMRRGDDAVVIAVEDEGPGIDPEALPRVFDRYFRERRKGHPEGLGLGLYITRLLVEAHGGRIEARSEPGRGSAFTVHLPARPVG